MKLKWFQFRSSKNLKRALSIFILLLLIAACKTYSEDDKAQFRKAIISYSKQKHENYTETESGLFVKIDSLGTKGESIQSQSIVSINYKGTFLSGKVFDRTHIKNVMRSELKGLIRGFQEALLGKQVGTKMQLIVPPYLGYGDMELEAIPKHSILCFELKVVEVE